MSKKSSNNCSFFFNLLVVIACVALLGIGATWYMEVQVIVDLFGRVYPLMCIIFMAGGGAGAITAILGCYGAMKKAVWALILFALITIVLVVCEIVLIILIYVKENLWDDCFISQEGDKYQLFVAGIFGGVAALEVTAAVVAFLAAKNIKKEYEDEE